MTPAGSVTTWMAQAQGGDAAALQALWQRYFPPLVRLVRGKLRRVPRAAADEEDVALSAFDSFYRRAAEGTFPQLADRHDLWSVLVMVASRKACDLVEHEQRGKRDWRRVQRGAEGGAPEASLLARIVSREPTPDFAAEVADSCRRLLAVLYDDELRAIALMKLEGLTNEEIAGRIDRAPASVERRLRTIRLCWQQSGDC
jgi:DNA-directed RNA polymerase specialized sigma24 family protein